MRILVVSCTSNPGHEMRNARLCAELRRRGYDARHTGPNRRFNTAFYVWPTFEDDYVLEPLAREAKTTLFSDLDELHRSIAWADVVLFGTAKGFTDSGLLARSLGKLVVQHRDSSGLDPHLSAPEVLAVPGPWEVQAVVNKGIPLTIPPIATGCVQYDDAAPDCRRLSKEQFFEKYRLDPDKKLATYLTQSPGHHNPRNLANDLRIIDTILAAGTHNLVLKLHPSDYFGSKRNRWHGDATAPIWEGLGRSLRVVEARDKYDCFASSDVIVSRGSTTLLETPLLHKPILFVDCAELVYSNEYDTSLLKKWFPEQRFSSPGLKPFSVYGCLDQRLEEIPLAEIRDKLIGLREWDRSNWGGQSLEYIGSECTVEELREVLESEAYVFDETAVYKDYVAKHAMANDGLAYKRLSDAMEGVLAVPELAKTRSRFRMQVLGLTIKAKGRKVRRMVGRTKASILNMRSLNEK